MRARVCVCVCACVYSKFPRECDITQHGPLLGELLLLPATPLLESMILHTHTIAPTEVTPTGPNFPLHLQPPAASQCVYVRARARARAPTVCLLGSRLNQCSAQNRSLPGLLPMTTNQPLKASISGYPNLANLSHTHTHTNIVSKPITGHGSQEGSVTWVMAVALATGIICAREKEEVKWTFHFLTNSKSCEQGSLS